jgi:exonuclease SbcC
MITRIDLINFMSHRRTVIEPAAGLTVLIGPNNCGKSAVVAALQILCRNENSTYVLRHGERECGITLHTDDGHVIEWRRKNSPSYRINGQAFDRLGRNGVPDELHQALRLPLVDGGAETDFDVHFGAQKSPIFLLGSSAQNAARFFASSSDAIRLVAMQKRHKDKLADAQRDKNRLEAQSKKLTAELDALAPVVDLDDRLAAAEQLFGEMALAQATLDDAEKLHTDWQAQFASLHRQTETCEVLNRLPPLPVMAPVEALGRLIGSMDLEERKRCTAAEITRSLSPLAAPPQLSDESALEKRTLQLVEQRAAVGQWQRECLRLADLPDPPELDELQPLDRLLQGLVSINQRASLAASTSAALAAVKSPPELCEESDLRQLASALARLTSEVARIERRDALLATLTDPPIAADTPPLAQFLEKFATAGSEVVRLANLLNQEEAALAEANAALCTAADGALCPVCGNEIDVDRLLAQSAAGRGDHRHD